MFRLPHYLKSTCGAMFCSLLLAACAEDRAPVRGFVLPEGSAERGEATFIALGCPQCHTVVDTAIEQPSDPPYSVPLGGDVMRVRHYGDLLTSIVNPDHRVRPIHQTSPDSDENLSPMPSFTETMTVTQLVDLVEFLHGKYTTMSHYGGRYYYYPGGS